VNYTPGPWKRADLLVYALNQGGSNQFSAQVQGDGRHGAKLDELRANARLVAAAPDLLEALQATLSMYRAYVTEDEIGPALVELAEAAIDKATDDA
jgi:hypothetical protein